MPPPEMVPPLLPEPSLCQGKKRQIWAEPFSSLGYTIGDIKGQGINVKNLYWIKQQVLPEQIMQ